MFKIEVNIVIAKLHVSGHTVLYAKIIHLHVIYVPLHSNKMVIRICTNYSFTCDIYTNTFH